MTGYQILTPKEVSWEDYKNLRLEALKNEPQAFGSSYKDQVNNADDIWQQN